MSKEMHTAETLAEIARQLRKQAARLITLSKSLEAEEIETLAIDHHKMMTRGLDAVENFLSSADRSLREHRRAHTS